MRSRRSWFPVLGWCAATLTSVALASVAMLPVLRTATADESALVSVDQLRDSTVFSPTPAPPPPSPGVTSPAPEKPRSPSAARSPSRTRSTPATRTPTTTSPPARDDSTTTVEDGWTVTTNGDGDRTYVRSFRMEGGQTVIRAADGVIKLVTATPADGFSVATVQNTADNLAVYFNEVNHSFIVHVVWQAGKPFAEVSEVGS
ncbi:DNA mismatch repair protein MutL [Couchioplanes caeruleus]|uniref:DNA mismatch repair protein MutL n=1 Tax=Couchioplanes caeruleus TaxID=56438 RepID=UPI0020BEF835|nr:DNA mismatch repair protein MutL [Couchioplanes caeruleus]UQU65131.1 DNA mismatch repair protein MutL [Couchioplanes caeruleus]